MTKLAFKSLYRHASDTLLSFDGARESQAPLSSIELVGRQWARQGGQCHRLFAD